MNSCWTKSRDAVLQNSCQIHFLQVATECHTQASVDVLITPLNSARILNAFVKMATATKNSLGPAILDAIPKEP